ncbi:hypothetical protein NE237_022595 [Protea cynaroides]|uniref:DUF7880 domain-containing protein n=1 Tax=Protea cynaroides TaxID=273540 RepID=A0A9Q0K4C9_9MAGN|nr:hypothetical protein NE237_022595 [Protea cynaroides]
MQEESLTPDSGTVEGVASTVLSEMQHTRLLWVKEGLKESWSMAATIFLNTSGSYVVERGKKLDQLEVYGPAVLLTPSQTGDLGKTLEPKQPQYATCRPLLHCRICSPAVSLGVNILAVAKYAAETGNGKTALDDVDQCLRALEELDSLFLRAIFIDESGRRPLIMVSATGTFLEDIPNQDEEIDVDVDVDVDQSLPNAPLDRGLGNSDDCEIEAVLDTVTDVLRYLYMKATKRLMEDYHWRSFIAYKPEKKFWLLEMIIDDGGCSV